MTDSPPPPGISIIEQMAAEHHKNGPSILPWDQLSKADRTRLIDQMEAAVRIIPDRLLLKRGTAFASVELHETRDALIGDLDASKASVLSGL